MSFGTSFGAAAPASQPSFNFGSQTTTATPVKPSNCLLFINITIIIYI